LSFAAPLQEHTLRAKALALTGAKASRTGGAPAAIQGDAAQAIAAAIVVAWFDHSTRRYRLQGDG
jgi:hypothetical protein